MADRDPLGFTTEEKEIFWYERFQAGKKRRVACDPIVAHRKLWEHLGADEDIFTRLKDKDEAVAAAASDKLDKAVIATFNMPPIDDDGSGATEKMRMKVLADFFDFTSDSAKSAETSPPTSPSTETLSCVASDSATPATPL